MNHKNDWIDPQFYKKIILLMCQEGLTFSQTEEVEFFQKLEEFKDYASQRRYTLSFRIFNFFIVIFKKIALQKY